MHKYAVVLATVVLANATVARAETPITSQEKPAWGMGAKVRRAWITPRVQKLFMGDVPATATMDGAGLDFARRTGSTEVVFGFGYDRLYAVDGYYLEKGGDPTVAGKVDYTTFHRPRWYTAEIMVVNHAELHKFLELRYGAGIGVGLVRGEIRQTDAICTGPSLEQDCTIDPAAVDVDKPADIFPVLPVVNVLVGFQLKPFRFLHLHVDAGLHTVPYVSVGATLYLW